MFTLIKNAHIYAPADTGCQDLLLAGRKIVHMAPSIGERLLTAPLLTSAGLKSLPVLLTSISILRAAAAKAALLPAYLKSSCHS